MSDLISRQVAIDELKLRFDGVSDSWQEMRDLVIDTLKDIPSAVDGEELSMDDLISRNAAIDAIVKEGRNVDSRYLESERIIHESDAVEAIAMLPSAESDYDLDGYSSRLWENAYTRGYNNAKREIALSGEYVRAYKRGKADAIRKR